MAFLLADAGKVLYIRISKNPRSGLKHIGELRHRGLEAYISKASSDFEYLSFVHPAWYILKGPDFQKALSTYSLEIGPLQT